MFSKSKLLLVAAIALVAFAAVASSATAATISASPAGAITSTSLGKMTFESNVFGIGPQCRVELIGSLNAGPIEKTAGREIGRITSARVTECIEGSASALVEANRPFILTYNSIAGTLPEAVTSALIYVTKAAFLISTSAASCLYAEGRVGASLGVTHTTGATYTTNLLTILADQTYPGERITKLSGLFACPTAPTLEGTMSLTRQTLTRG